MNDFLRRIGLLDNLTIEMRVSMSDFFDTLNANIDHVDGNKAINRVFPLDLFSRNKRPYKGTITDNGFVLRRPRKLLETRYRHITSRGAVKHDGEKLIAQVEINAYKPAMMAFLIIIAIVYTVSIAAALTTDVPFFVLPFILFHAALMIGIPYWVLRRSVRQTKYELERDLWFMMRGKLGITLPTS